MRIPALLAAVLAGLIAGSPAAHATAFAGIEQAFWSVTFVGFSDEAAPGAAHDITWLCGGDSGAIEDLSCSETISGTVSLDRPGQKSLSMVQPGEVRITNNAGTADVFFLTLSRSAFNPGGSPIGASIDDPSRESARFESWVLGPEPTSLPFILPAILDMHGCTATATSPQCGVGTPDESTSLLGLNLAPFETLVLPFELGLVAEVRVVSEPGLALSVAGAAGLLAMWRRRQARRAAFA